MVLTWLPYALHALALSMILFTSAHVQIAIRVLPAGTPKCFVVGGPRDEEAQSEGSFVASGVGREGPRSWWAFTSHLWVGWSAVWLF
ncbi:hypothetical protein BDV93DRAFT_524774, partial [Ceratobasidium sp. AG-I]